MIAPASPEHTHPEPHPGGSPPSRAPRWRGPATCVAIAVSLLIATYILWVCFNAEPGRVGLEFPFDLVFYYYPMLEQASERLRAGELPLWNPYQCCGVPFLATAQAAVFYPPTWITLVLPVGLAIRTLMFGQVLVAGVFACLYFRALGNRLFASSIGGILFIFSCILGQIYWPSEVSTIVWLPFLMWSAERFIQSGRWGWWALFTLGVACQALAGFPQFMVYTFYLLGPYVLVRLIWGPATSPALACGAGVSPASPHATDGSSASASSAPLVSPASDAQSVKSRLFRKSGALLAGCIIAAGLASIQLAPTLELARNTARNGKLTPQGVHYLESERGKYFTLPGLLTNMFDPSAKMITFDFPDGSGYLGMAMPLLVGMGLVFGRRDRRIWFFVIAAVISCTLAFGYNPYSGWLYRLYAYLPTGNMFRTPSRLLLLTYFSLITIAVFGLDRLGDSLNELRGKIHLRIILAVMAVCLLSAASAIGGDDGVRLAAGFILLIVAAYLVGQRRVPRCTIQALFAALLVFDLAHAIAPYGSLRDIPVEWGQRPHWGGVSPVKPGEFAAAIDRAGLNRIALPGLRPTKMIQPPKRFHMVTEYEPLLPERWHWTNKTMGGEHGFVMCMIDADKYSAFYDMAGVTQMFRTSVSDLAKKRMGPRQWEIHHRVPGPAPAGMDCVLEQRATALPRAYLVGRYELCEPADALHRFVSASFDYRNGVLLEQDPGLKSDPSSTMQPAEIVSYAPERAVVRTNAPEPRLLVLTDTFFPGWTAHVDGAEAPILRANYLFRAVSVPAGPHEVVFEYRPAGFRVGLAISSVAFVAFIGVAGVAWRRERRATSDRPGHSTTPASDEYSRGPMTKD